MCGAQFATGQSSLTMSSRDRGGGFCGAPTSRHPRMIASQFPCSLNVRAMLCWAYSRDRKDILFGGATLRKLLLSHGRGKILKESRPCENRKIGGSF